MRKMSEQEEAVAKKLGEGKDRKKIVKELIKDGWSEELAIQLVDSVQEAIEEYNRSPEGRRILANKHKRHMFFGSLWVVGGTIATIATYSAASGGGVYFIFWGAIVFGLFDFLRGLSGWLKYRE